MRLVFTTLLIASLTFPLFVVKNNSLTDTAIDYLKEIVLDGNWGYAANEIIEFSEKILKEEKKSEEIFLSKIKNNVLTGYGIGFSSIGAAFVSWNNFRFNRFEIVPVLPLFIILLILLQIVFHNYLYQRRNAILSVLNMLLVLSVYGNCIGNEHYSGYLNGILLFIAVQIFYMIYFYWFPYKKVTIEHDENQSS